MPDLPNDDRNLPAEANDRSEVGNALDAARSRPSRLEASKTVGKAAAQALLAEVPLVGPLVSAAWTAVEQLEGERRLKYVETLAEATGETMSEIQAVLGTNEGLAELFIRAMNASAEARSSEKIRMLAGIVAGARRGDEQAVDLGHTMLGVVEGLEPLHMQVLSLSRSMESPQRTSEDSEKPSNGVTVVDLADRLETRFDLVKMVCEDLHSQNLLVDTFAGTWFAVDGARSTVSLTSLARELLRLLDSVGDGTFRSS